MDVRFERVAEAVAAMSDFEHLALISNKQSARPRACKVLLEPVTFECGAYTAAVADATDTTAATKAAVTATVGATTLVASAQQQQQQQQQSLLPVEVQSEAAPVPAIVIPTAKPTAAAAATASSTGKCLTPRTQTPEYPSTDDDRYCGTGAGTLARTALQQQEEAVPLTQQQSSQPQSQSPVLQWQQRALARQQQPCSSQQPAVALRVCSSSSMNSCTYSSTLLALETGFMMSHMCW
jgi:hypothetical protein